MVDIWCPHGIRVLSFPIRGKPLSRGFQRKASPRVREPFRIGVQQQLEIRKIWFCWWPILTHVSNFKMYLSNKGLLGEWCVWAVIGSYLHPLNSQETWELGNDGIRKEGRCKKYELLWKRIMNFEMDLTPLFLKYINWISFRSVSLFGGFFACWKCPKLIRDNNEEIPSKMWKPRNLIYFWSNITMVAPASRNGSSLISQISWQRWLFLYF